MGIDRISHHRCVETFALSSVRAISLLLFAACNTLRSGHTRCAWFISSEEKILCLIFSPDVSDGGWTRCEVIQITDDTPCSCFSYVILIGRHGSLTILAAQATTSFVACYSQPYPSYQTGWSRFRRVSYYMFLISLIIYPGNSDYSRAYRYAVMWDMIRL